MNILKVEQKFQELERKEKLIEYTFNPRLKSVPGLKRHRFIRDLSYDVETDCQAYGFDPYFLAPSPDKAEDVAEKTPVQGSIVPVVKAAVPPIPKRRIINKSALRELKYESRCIPSLSKTKTVLKQKSTISVDKMKEQYHWLHHSATHVHAEIIKPKIAILTIDRTSLTVPETHQVPPVAQSNVTPIDSKLIQSFAGSSRGEKQSEAGSEHLTFLLQFKCTLPQASSPSNVFVRVIDITELPYPFVCFDGLGTDADGYVLFPNGSTYFTPLGMMPWIQSAESLKGRLIKIEIYHKNEMLCIKYCTLDSLTAENYWSALLKIAHHCRIEHYIIKKYTWIKGGDQKVYKPSNIIKEYQRHQIISEARTEEGCIVILDYMEKIVYYVLSNNLIRQFNRATYSSTSNKNPIDEKTIVVRGETLIEFKGCAIKAVNGNTLKVISGDVAELLSTRSHIVITKGNNMYEIHRKNSFTDYKLGKSQERCRTNPSATMYRNQRNNTNWGEYGELERNEVSQYLNAKPLLSSSKERIRLTKRKGREGTKKETSKTADMLDTHARKKEAQSRRLVIQGYFVNKLYE